MNEDEKTAHESELIIATAKSVIGDLSVRVGAMKPDDLVELLTTKGYHEGVAKAVAFGYDAAVQQIAAMLLRASDTVQVVPEFGIFPPKEGHRYVAVPTPNLLEDDE